MDVFGLFGYNDTPHCSSPKYPIKINKSWVGLPGNNVKAHLPINVSRRENL